LRDWISVRDTGTDLGRGVYAERSFEQGQIVEVCPVVVLEAELRSLPEPLRRIFFNWREGQYAMALGYGSIYNHADEPNLEFERDFETLVMRFTAVRRIERGEQLTINYNQVEAGKHKKKDWFKANQVEKIEIER
jgi:SET domain-containing protein